MRLLPSRLSRRIGRSLEVTFRRIDHHAPAAAPLRENWHEDFIVQLASVLRPRTYVELGLYRCELFNRVVPYAGILYGVDTNASAYQFMERASGKSHFFHGSTAGFTATLPERGICIDLLFIDADHSSVSVNADFRAYFPFVRDHGIVLFHDTYPMNPRFAEPGYCGDGYRAVAELTGHSTTYEMMTIPRHPGLTLCRKRVHHLPWT